MEAPNEIMAKVSHNWDDCKTGTWTTLGENPELVSYTRSDLVTELADALEGCHFLLKAHTGPDNVMAENTLVKAKAALQKIGR